MSTFSLFEVGRSALLASKRSMDVTGHNVANYATPGYSRQETILEPIIQRMASISGVGVKVAGIARSRDLFIDSVLRAETGKAAAFAVQRDVVDQIQVIAAEPSDNSIRVALENFWSAWHDLSIDPGSGSARAQVMERGRSLADMFRHVGGQLDSLKRDVEAGLESAVSRVNLLSERVVDFNLEISRAMARNEPAADLLDQRDLLLDELAEMTGATVVYLQEGASVRVSVGGYPLVDLEQTYKIEVGFTSQGTEFRWAAGPGESVPMDSMGGLLGGYRGARDEMVLGFKGELESLLVSIVDNVNDLHRAGYPISGPPLDFFQVGSTSYLSSVAVNPVIVADPGAICASQVPGDRENGQMALAIADLLGGESPPAEGVLSDIWTGMVGKLGALGQRVGSGYEVQEILVKGLRNRKDSICGVSIDEEIATLVRQQHAFGAASRLITVADEIIDTIVNKMGLAGR